jgi:hypothetical protein
MNLDMDDRYALPLAVGLVGSLVLLTALGAFDSCAPPSPCAPDEVPVSFTSPGSGPGTLCMPRELRR